MERGRGRALPEDVRRKTRGSQGDPREDVRKMRGGKRTVAGNEVRERDGGDPGRRVSLSERSLRRDAEKEKKLKYKNATIPDGIPLPPNYPPWRVRDQLGNRYAGRDGNRGGRGGRRVSREEDEEGRPTGSEEGAERRGVSKGVTRIAEKEGARRESGGKMEEARKKGIQNRRRQPSITSYRWPRLDGQKLVSEKEHVQRCGYGASPTVGTMLFQEGDQIGRAMREVCNMLRTTHIDGERIQAYFGRRQKVKSAGVLEEISREGYRPKSGREAISGVT